MGNKVCYSQGSEIRNDPIVQGYFQTIYHTQKKFYEANAKNIINLSICLEKKDFAANVITSRKIDYRIVKDEMIDWYKYLYYYLYKQIDKDLPWAGRLLAALEKEYFVLENKYQSMFFFQEFQIYTKPNTLKQIRSYSDDSDEDDEIEDITASTTNVQTGKPKKICTTKNYGGSFISMNNEALLPGDPGIQYKCFRNQVKEYVTYFNKHIQEEDHPINFISTVFCEIFSDYVNYEIEELRKLSCTKPNEYKEELFKKTLDITKQLQKFIIKLQTILKLFYSNTLNYQCFTEEKDELIISVTSLIFQNENIYQCIYDLYQLSEQDLMKNLDKQFKELKNIKPEDLNINVKFRLDATTLEYQKELLLMKEQEKKEMKTDLVSKDNEDMIKTLDIKIEQQANYPESSNNTNEDLSMQLNIIEDSSINPSEYLHNLKDTLISIDNIASTNTEDIINLDKNNINHSYNVSNKFKKFQVEQDNQQSKGYKAATKLLETIRRYRTPFEKMMILSKISELITNSVNDFWKNMKSIITPSFLSIDADNIMSLIIYILIKSRLSEIAIHIRMIKQFTTSITKSSIIGYYYSTFDAAINFVEEIKIVDNKIIPQEQIY